MNDKERLRHIHNRLLDMTQLVENTRQLRDFEGVSPMMSKLIDDHCKGITEEIVKLIRVSNKS